MNAKVRYDLNNRIDTAMLALKKIEKELQEYRELKRADYAHVGNVQHIAETLIELEHFTTISPK